MSYENQINEFIRSGGKIIEAQSTGRFHVFNSAISLEAKQRRQEALSNGHYSYDSCTPCCDCQRTIRRAKDNACVACAKRRKEQLLKRTYRK